jgi:hypothetical protein
VSGGIHCIRGWERRYAGDDAGPAWWLPGIDGLHLVAPHHSHHSFLEATFECRQWPCESRFEYGKTPTASCGLPARQKARAWRQSGLVEGPIPVSLTRLSQAVVVNKTQALRYIWPRCTCVRCSGNIQKRTGSSAVRVRLQRTPLCDTQAVTFELSPSSQHAT